MGAIGLGTENLMMFLLTAGRYQTLKCSLYMSHLSQAMASVDCGNLKGVKGALLMMLLATVTTERSLEQLGALTCQIRVGRQIQFQWSF